MYFIVIAKGLESVLLCNIFFIFTLPLSCLIELFNSLTSLTNPWKGASLHASFSGRWVRASSLVWATYWKTIPKFKHYFSIFTFYLINCCSYLQRCFFVPNGSFQSPNMLFLVINLLFCSRKMILQSSMCLSSFSNTSSKGVIRFIPWSPHTICTFSNGWINLFSQTVRLLTSSYIRNNSTVI